MKKIFRCDICGKISEKKKKCCGEEMKDLTSPECMACQGCGFFR